MRKIGIILHSKQDLPDKEFVEIVSELGFDSIFTSFREAEYQAELAELFAKYNLIYESIHAPFQGINKIWSDVPEGEEMYKQLLMCVDHCVLANVPIMVVHLSAGYTPPEMSDIGKYRFEKIVDYAVSKNVQIAFENIYNLENLIWAFDRFEKGSGVGFCWDIGHEHCFTQGIEFMKYFGDRLIYTHIHDNMCELDKDQHFIPFDGAIDFERVAKDLRDNHYEGTLTLEVLSQRHKKYEDISAREYLERSADAVKKLAKMVDQEL